MIIPYLLKIILRGAAIKNGNCYIISARGSSSRRLWPPQRQTLDWKVDCELPYEFYGKERSPELTANKYKAGFEQLRHWTTVSSNPCWWEYKQSHRSVEGTLWTGRGCGRAPPSENWLGFYLDNCFLISFRQVLCLTLCLFPLSHDLQNRKTFKFKIIVLFSPNIDLMS